MEVLGVLEILDRRGRPTQRVRLEAVPFRIGRAPSNHLILDDGFVSPQHVVITGNGAGLVAEDLASLNGMHSVSPQERVSSLALGPGTQMRVGRTILRFRRADESVPEATPDQSALAGAWLERPAAAVALWVVALGASTLWVHLANYEPFKLEYLAGMSALMAGLVLSWVAVWSLMSRLVAHEWRFVAHCSVAALFIVTNLVLEETKAYIEFAFSPGWGAALVWFVLDGAVLVVLVGGHLAQFTSPQARRRGVLITIVLVGFYGGLSALSTLQRTQLPAYIQFDSELRPAPATWLPREPIEDFLSRAQSLHDEVDGLVAKD